MNMVEYKQVKGKDLKRFGKFVKINNKKELYLKEGIHCLPRFELSEFIVKANKNNQDNE